MSTLPALTASSRPSLALIGAGRLGSALALAAHHAGYVVKAIHTRSPERAQSLATITGARLLPDVPSLVRSAELIFIAVPDDVIAEIDAAGAGAWQPGTGVVHHSGLHSTAILQHAAAAGAHTGTLHPLQAITESAEPDLLRGAYFGVSGSPDLMPVLEAFVSAIGGHPLAVPDDAKPLYHAAAVFASNYVVTCFAQAVDLLVGLGIARADAERALLPLVRGAVANLEQPGLPHALTGPITRGDAGTVRTHQRFLAEHRPDLLLLYQLLGQHTIPIAAAQGTLSPASLQRAANRPLCDRLHNHAIKRLTMKTTILHIQRKKERGEPIVMLTAYDYTGARLAAAAGVDILLVGDSLGMVIQGHDTTLPVTLDDIIYHTRAVVRGAPDAFVVADMPFMTYQVSAEQALVNAGRVLQETGAQAVKLEGGAHMASTIQRLVQVGIPVMGHIGLTPQSVHQLGGWRVQGRSPEEADRLLADARALVDAGVFAIVLELVPLGTGCRHYRPGSRPHHWYWGRASLRWPGAGFP